MKSQGPTKPGHQNRHGKDMRDNRAMGFSRHCTVGVWVGNASGAPQWDLSGTTSAAPVWVAVISFLHRTQASRAPTPPMGLVQTRAEFGAQLEATCNERFIAVTEQILSASNYISNNALKTGGIARKDFKNGKTYPPTSQTRRRASPHPPMTASFRWTPIFRSMGSV